MTIYLIECSECETSWDVVASMDKPPKRRKCKKCGKFGRRVLTSPYPVFIGADWESNSYRQKKFAEKGLDKDSANKFLKDSIELSKERMKTGGEHYKRMVTTPEHLATTQGLKKTTPKRAYQKYKLLKKIKTDIKNKMDRKK